MKKNIGSALKRSFKHYSGFTLIELLIVISVISILIAVAVPAFHGMREGAMRTQARGDLRTLKLAIENYYQNNNNLFPNVGNDDGDWQTDLLNAYPRMLSVRLYDPFVAGKQSYLYSLAHPNNGTDPTPDDYYVIYSVGPSGSGYAIVDKQGNVRVNGDAIWVSNGQSSEEAF